MGEETGYGTPRFLLLEQSMIGTCEQDHLGYQIKNHMISFQLGCSNISKAGDCYSSSSTRTASYYHLTLSWSSASDTESAQSLPEHFVIIIFR